MAFEGLGLYSATLLKNLPGNPFTRFRFPGEKYRGNQESDTIRPITKTFDEPTYFTFRLEFTYDGMDNNLNSTNFDRIPHPLFSTYKEENINARNYYSTYNYLMDIDEAVRAQMLLEFIDKWTQLQTEYQWYFQSISGLNSLMSIKPKNGRRVAEDARLTIKMFDALDMRVTHLLNLYRKIAWDDVYQRWVLPDMMRYFRVLIYVTEFRLFHTPVLGTTETNPGEEIPLNLGLLTGTMPTYVLELEMCEFDIETFNLLPDSIEIGEAQMRELEFGIKVGNMKERYLNPIFNSFWHDMLLNGYDRSEDKPKALVANVDKRGRNLMMESGKAGAYDFIGTEEHTSGKPFIQKSLGDTNLKISSRDYHDINSVNPIDPATWIGNTFTLGKALLTNLVESKVDELKVKKIPGLGISFNEALAAIQSKNVFTVYGAVRRAINQTAEAQFPSYELQQNFVDTQFKEYLKGIAESEATNEPAAELQKAANIILNDNGVWEQIKDLSKATNLFSSALGEVNIPVKIENPNALKVNYRESYQPVPIQDGIVMEGLPSSLATGSNLEGSQLITPQKFAATSVDQVQEAYLKEGNQSSIEPVSNIPKEEEPNPSEELGNTISESLKDPGNGLGNNAGTDLEEPRASELLSDKIVNKFERPGIGLKNILENKEKMITLTPGEAVDGDNKPSNKMDNIKPSKELSGNLGDKLKDPGNGLNSNSDTHKLDYNLNPGEAVDDDNAPEGNLSKTKEQSKATKNKLLK